jgi:phenylalanyl-tRNA synthetase beta chain
MPTITIDKKDLLKQIGKNFSDDKLKDRISMLGTDLEKVTKKDITVEIFPNRPDMLSSEGFARALSSFIGVKKGLKKYKVKKSGYNVVVDKSVSVRPYTVCALVKNLKFTDEKIKNIMQVQEKLSLTHGRNRKKSEYGIYPSDKINFPINYIAKDPKEIMFKPLGMSKEIRADQVEEIHSTGKEFKHITKDWIKYPFFIDNKENVLSMLPYTNSEDIGKIDETTKNVFIECTGIDLQNVMFALNIFTTTLADMGGEIYSVDIIYPDKTITTPNLEPKKMKINFDYVNKILGLDLKEKEIKDCLERMGFGYKNKEVSIPCYRTDILHEIDLIEDIAIAYGYENFESEIPNVSTVAKEDSFEKFKNKIAEILVGFGLIETNTYNLTNKNEQTKNMEIELDLVKISNALNEDYNVLRRWMIPSLLNILKNNKHYGYPQKIFEIGTVFTPKEISRLGVLLCHKEVSYTESRQILEKILDSLGLKYSFKEVEHDSFIPGRVARVYVEGKGIAYVGELHPSVLNNFELEMPVSCFELNLNELFDIINS